MVKFAMNYGMKMDLLSEFSDDSDCDGDMVVEFLSDSDQSDSDQSDSSDDEDNVTDDSDMQYEAWTELGAERPHFPFSGKPGLNGQLEDPNNLLDYFEYQYSNKNPRRWRNDQAQC
jgi:hypothetical protein